MVKNVDGYLLIGSLNRKFIVKVRFFSSAKTSDMWDYIKPTKRTSILIFMSYTLEQQPHINNAPEQIAKHIFDIVISFKTDSNTVIVFNIVPRGHKNKEKAEKAIQIINNACVQRNIPVINHTNMNSKRHLNRSKLHLNGYGKSIFV